MRVRVIDWGKIYTTYDKWLTNNDCGQYLDNYRQEEKLFSCAIQRFYGDKYTPLDKYGTEVDMRNITYEVLKENVHGVHDNTILLLIQEPISNKVYLINKNGTEEMK